MRKRLAGIGLAVLVTVCGLGILLPAGAQAMGARSGDSVTLPKGQTQNGTFFVAGKNLTLDGDVNGDLFCAGSNVSITGTVRGDVICAAQTITISGHVEGDIRLAAQTVTLTGQIDRNASVLTQTFMLGSGTVAGDLGIAGQTVAVNAPVGRDFFGAIDSLTINAPVAGRVDAVVEQLSLGADARIGSDLSYTSKQTFNLDQSKVSGKIEHHTPPAEKKLSPRELMLLWLTNRLFWIVSSLILALAIIWMAPRLMRAVTNAMRERPGASIAWGLGILFLVPVLLVLALFSLVGISLVLVLGALWFAAVVAAQVFAGVALGRRILQSAQDAGRESLPIAALVGIPLLLLAAGLPVIGWLISLLALVWALGGMILAFNRARR